MNYSTLVFFFYRHPPHIHESRPSPYDRRLSGPARLLTTSYTIATHERGGDNPFDVAANSQDDDDGPDVGHQPEDDVFTPVAPASKRQPFSASSQSRISKPSPRPRPSDSAPGTPGTPGREFPPTPTSSSSSSLSSGGTLRRRPTVPSAGDFVDEETPDLEFDESDFLTTLTICMLSP